MEIYNQTKHNVSDYEKTLKEVFSFSTEDFSIIFVTNKEIKALNKKYRNLNKVTDVLSFTSDEEYLGDIFISLKRAFKQAKQYGHSKKREIAFLAVHGYLHLLGYDHQTKEDEAEMILKQKEILNKANIKRSNENGFN